MSKSTAEMKENCASATHEEMSPLTVLKNVNFADAGIITMNENQPDMLQATDRCDCGHMAKSHLIANPEKVDQCKEEPRTKCRFCDCKEMSF